MGTGFPARQGRAGQLSPPGTVGSGRRFLIEQATPWELRDPAGVVHGQAVVIPHTQDL